MPTLTIGSIQCVTPSTGVAGWWEKAVNELGSVLGKVVGDSAATALDGVLDVATDGVAIFLTPLEEDAGSTIGGKVGGALASAANSLSKSIGQDIADQLYVKVNGKKIWPSDKDHRIKANETVNVNYHTSFSTSIVVELMEWDMIKDDNLGQTTFTTSSQSGVYMFANSKEQDIYAVAIQITP